MTDVKILELPSGVQLGTFSTESLYELWMKIRDYTQLFDDEQRYDWQYFLSRINNPRTVVLKTDGGILLLTEIHENSRAEAHVIFWDNKLTPRLKLIRDCVSWAFMQFNLQRLEVIIPEFCRALKRFIEEKLNFHYEGRMRKRMLYKGQFADILIYSLLKEEVL